MVLTGGYPGLPLPAQGWTLDSAGPGTRTNPPFSQLLHLLPRLNVGVKGITCSLPANSSNPWLTRGIASKSQTPDTPVNKLGPLPGSDGHGFIAGHPASLTPRGPPGLSDGQHVPVPSTGTARAPSPGLEAP